MTIDKMPNSWQRAVSRYERWRSRGRLKPEVEDLTNAMLERLRSVETADALVKKYYLGNYWAVQLIRRKYPGRDDLVDLGITADVAYAKRYQELTGEDLATDPGSDEDDEA